MATTPFLTGQRLTADLLNANIIDVPEVITVAATIGTASAGFTASSVRAALLANGKLINLDMLLAVTSTITATSGNIADTTCFTLNSGYRPSAVCEIAFDNGSAGGNGVINTDGAISLRAAYATISSGTNIRISATFIVG